MAQETAFPFLCGLLHAITELDGFTSSYRLFTSLFSSSSDEKKFFLLLANRCSAVVTLALELLFVAPADSLKPCKYSLFFVAWSLLSGLGSMLRGSLSLPRYVPRLLDFLLSNVFLFLNCKGSSPSETNSSPLR